MQHLVKPQKPPPEPRSLYPSLPQCPAEVGLQSLHPQHGEAATEASLSLCHRCPFPPGLLQKAARMPRVDLTDSPLLSCRIRSKRTPLLEDQVRPQGGRSGKSVSDDGPVAPGPLADAPPGMKSVAGKALAVAAKAESRHSRYTERSVPAPKQLALSALSRGDIPLPTQNGPVPVHLHSLKHPSLDIGTPGHHHCRGGTLSALQPLGPVMYKLPPPQLQRLALQPSGATRGHGGPSTATALARSPKPPPSSVDCRPTLGGEEGGGHPHSFLLLAADLQEFHHAGEALAQPQAGLLALSTQERQLEAAGAHCHRAPPV
mmetsp:Transcript_51939/g.118458  ORF Transcript_51939/g.118458 Transcript_51939/m.118458 type:complete len:317 (+) Transcript_51939:993-1943(+)